MRYSEKLRANRLGKHYGYCNQNFEVDTVKKSAFNTRIFW